MTPKKGPHVPSDWQGRFLKALAQYGNVSYAAKYAGVSRGHAYETRNADPGFAVQWSDALDQSADVLEKEAWRRAVQGTKRKKGIYYEGEQIATEVITEYSDTLLIFLLKGARPQKFRDNQHLEIDQRVTFPDFDTALDKAYDVPDDNAA